MCKSLPLSLSVSQSRIREPKREPAKFLTSPSVVQQRITELDQQREELKIEVSESEVISPHYRLCVFEVKVTSRFSAAAAAGGRAAAGRAADGAGASAQTHRAAARVAGEEQTEKVPAFGLQTEGLCLLQTERCD